MSSSKPAPEAGLVADLKKTCDAAARDAAQKAPAPFRVEVRIPSGDLLHAVEVEAGVAMTGATLRKALCDAKVQGAEYANLVCGEVILLATDLLPPPADGEEALLVTFVRGEKPAPPPADSDSSSGESIWTPGGGHFLSHGGYCGPGSECLAGDCVLTVREGGVERPRLMSELKVGDEVATGARKASDAYRRVTRIWPSPQPKGRRTGTVRLSEGCRLTASHPVMSGGKWVRPLALGPEESAREDVIYGLEVEGHVDTVLVGGFVVAAIGVYCGEDFGWNIFTRKTVPCDRRPCAKCAVAVDASIDFSRIRPADLVPRFPPY